jgi:hypothetical protein
LRALQKSPADRYASARTFVSALKEAYDGRRPARNRRRRISVPFALTFAIGILLALWVGVETCESAGSGAGAGTDAGADTDTGADTGAGAGADTDAGADPLSPHEREELAKDALQEARDAIADGELEKATAALDRASELDPGNPDIAELRGKLVQESPDGG